MTLKPWQRKMQVVIFEADTFGGKLFDIVLLVAIVLSVGVVMLESVPTIASHHRDLMRALEWVFTILFTLEYIARLVCTGKPWKYAFSFFGMVDLLSILPTYLAILVAGSQALLVVRTIRLIRVFRILKLAQFLGEARSLTDALKASRYKIILFLTTVSCITIILGTLMYLIEGPQNGFTSIPKSVYWAIVTLTTVGYGDVAPQTALGQTVASLIMILGYAIIAVPTGIVSAEMVHTKSKTPEKISTQSCPQCAREGHEPDALYCKFCGSAL
ncbi:MAG: ion transporter [Flavobacteriales bacterium]|nr:ion transporter [Flavobacteriales bacterium]